MQFFHRHNHFFISYLPPQALCGQKLVNAGKSRIEIREANYWLQFPEQKWLFGTKAQTTCRALFGSEE